MTETRIDLKELLPNGKIEYGVDGGGLTMTAARAIHDVGYNIRRDRITSYMKLPGTYRPPLRIDLSLRVDCPEVLLLAGEGHVSFASPWMENRRIEDIAEPAGKPKTYDNYLPLGEFTDVSVVYDLNSMRISIGGEERYFSKNERYIKSKIFQAPDAPGINFAITCTKRAELVIRSITITEYDAAAGSYLNADIKPGKPPAAGTAAAAANVKPTFDSCIADLPGEIKNEIIETERFLKSLKNLKFKRTIEKHGNKITYVESNRGVSYALYLSGRYMHHSFQWYIITYGKPETWHRVANPLEAALMELDKTSPELAGRIFYNLNECIGCRENCMAMTAYSFGGQKKTTCHGQVFFKMSRPDFRDVRDFFAFYNDTDI